MLRRRRAAYVVINDNGEPVMPPAIYAALEPRVLAAYREHEARFTSKLGWTLVDQVLEWP